jgi:hypothetical protein
VLGQEESNDTSVITHTPASTCLQYRIMLNSRGRTRGDKICISSFICHMKNHLRIEKQLSKKISINQRFQKYILIPTTKLHLDFLASRFQALW